MAILSSFDYGIGSSANDRHSIINETAYLYKDIDEWGFPFNFTCNNDKRVYYQGYFKKLEVTYSDKHGRTINGIQLNYNIDIIDCIKLTRDFENITKNTIKDIIRQLLPKCLEIESSGVLNIKPPIFNVNV